MSGYPIVLEGTLLRATVVGGGAVALRKIRALRDAGAMVHVVAREPSAELVRLADGDPLVELTTSEYAPSHLAGARIVFATTDDPAVNDAVAQDARRFGQFVNVADAGDAGDFVTPAVHRAGDVVISVATGGVPGAAARIRDEIARRFDGRYARAVALLRELRQRLLGRGGDARRRAEPAHRAEWERASAELVAADFCAAVESGDIEQRVAAWR